MDYMSEQLKTAVKFIEDLLIEYTGDIEYNEDCCDACKAAQFIKEYHKRRES